MKERKKWMAPGDTPKPRVKLDLHPKRIMTYGVWWDWEGMVHWGMFKKNAMVNKELYIAQLHCVNEAIRLKARDRGGQTRLLHDNARHHVAQVVKSTLQEHEWEVLQHSPFSAGLALTDYHLFHSLSNHMKGVTFDNNLFNARPDDFWRNGINKLVERWKEIVNSNGEYIID